MYEDAPSDPSKRSYQGGGRGNKVHVLGPHPETKSQNLGYLKHICITRFATERNYFLNVA